MNYIVMFLPPVAALVIFLVAIKLGFHKQSFIVTLGITMVLTMFAMKYLSWYGVICVITGGLALIYVLLSLILSIMERREK